MNQTKLLFGLASVFAGLATVQAVFGFVSSPIFFGLAIPFGAAAYLMWYHASGRLEKRVRKGRAGEYREKNPETGGFGAGPRESSSAQSRFGAEARQRARQARANRNRTRQSRARAPNQSNAGPSITAASRTLGVSPDADSEQVRKAYRQKVKSVHPDREEGDEEQFKQVQEAYERLQNRS